MANVLPTEKRAAVVRCLVEGNSIRGTVRMTGVAKNTVVKLLLDLGSACSEYQAEVLRDLDSERIQIDEVWSFVYSKQKNVPEDRRDDPIGSVWTWTAIDADTKLIPAWLVGERTYNDATAFVSDLAMRMKYRIQLTSDGYKPYLHAVKYAFGNDVDYAILHKLYGKDASERAGATYSPAKCIGTKRQVISGDPDRRHISTSYVERSNLTLRMGCRRFTRLTNAFSKKIENLAAAVSLHFMHYNFARPHSSLGGKTPAMAAGKASHVWTIEEIVGLLDDARRENSN